jgi:FkbM family methyltransferase
VREFVAELERLGYVNERGKRSRLRLSVQFWSRMLAMFRRALNSILFRAKWARLGVWFLRSRDFHPSVVKVAGRRIELSFPAGEREEQEYELGQIYFDDCYRLRDVTPAPATIVDIGANVGLFSLVARHHFPRATIHCYEPNRSLAPILERHLGALGVMIFHEAVGAHAGVVQLVSEAAKSMYSKVRDCADGGVPMVSLDTVVKRCGGSIDLLKLDCEGSEWVILENSAAVDHVNEITMEFHLWARPGSTTDYLSSLLRRRGFKVVSQRNQQTSWGLLHAKREPTCAA